MADKFEKEHELFGADGFEIIAARVAQLEQQMGIHDLDQFTPSNACLCSSAGLSLDEA